VLAVDRQRQRAADAGIQPREADTAYRQPDDLGGVVPLPELP